MPISRRGLLSALAVGVTVVTGGVAVVVAGSDPVPVAAPEAPAASVPAPAPVAVPTADAPAPAPASPRFTPRRLRAFGGGADVALLWNPAPGARPRSYVVHRDGAQVGTVAAPRPRKVPHNARWPLATTVRYYDSGLQPGQTAEYQVAMVDAQGRTSALSPPLRVTRPRSTAVPRVSIDSATPKRFRPWLEDGATLIRHWYPKFAHVLVKGSYTPADSITLVVRPDPNTSIAYADPASGTIVVNADFARAHSSEPDSINFVVHEAVHILQADRGATPPVITEGIAEWARLQMFNDVDAVKPATDQFPDDGYAPAAYLIQRGTRYAPDLPHKLNVAAHNGTYSEKIFRQETGRTVAQLWKEATGRALEEPAPIVGPGGKCVDVDGRNWMNGTRIKLLRCKDDPAQLWRWAPSSHVPRHATLRALRRCLDVDWNVAGNGAPVQLWECTGKDNQLWEYRSDGSLVSRSTGRCLQPRGAKLQDGTPLEVWDCNGSPAQRWGPEGSD